MTHELLAAAIRLHRSGQLPEAEAIYRQILAADPNHADALQLLGAIAHQLGPHGIAIELIERSLTIAPGNGRALNNLGEALRATGQIARSIESFRAALQIDPNYTKAHSNLLMTLHFDPASTGESLRREHEAFGAKFPSPAAAKRELKSMLRIGYVSPDFKRHSVAYFIEPVIRHHHRDRVHVTCYSNDARGDEVTERIRASADQWRDISHASDDDAAGMIQRDNIDILLDLTGHMARNRLSLFAMKPAPVQATYLGYPNTTGLRQIDFRITDAIADPPGVADSHCVERLVRLPHCAWCYQPPENAPHSVVTPDRPIMFGSFNKFPKISPKTIQLWACILDAVPGSRLLLKAKSLGDASTQVIARQMLNTNGIGEDRVELRGWTGGTDEHLRAYNDIDIALDPFPYNGTTTTCEAMWMGVPVITLAGDKHVSRVGASLVTAVGHAEWSADTPDQYVAIATALAADGRMRNQLRSTLRQQMAASPLMDADAFATNLESAYHQMLP